MRRDRLFWIVMAVLGGGLLLLMINDRGGTTLGLSNDDFGSLVALGAIGLAVASGIVASRARFGDGVRNLAIWVFIVLALVAAYQYRYELQDVASRISAGLVPGSPMSMSDADGRATVTLSRRADGHFAARILIDGTPIHAMVDTGATATVLTAADAGAAGFDPAGLAYNIPVSTANGTARAARVTAGEVSIGGISRRNLPILVAEAGRLDQSLLGMNFIGSLSGFDMRGDRMILRD